MLRAAIGSSLAGRVLIVVETMSLQSASWTVIANLMPCFRQPYAIAVEKQSC